MYDRAREMDNIHSDAGPCRGSSCEKIWQFFRNLRGGECDRKMTGLDAVIGHAMGGCGDPQFADWSQKGRG
jgi:hypothetical protein